MKRLILFALLILAHGTAAAADSAGAPKGPAVAEIRFAADLSAGFAVQQDRRVLFGSEHVSKFRIVPGFRGPDFVSFEIIGQSGGYLRHQKFVVYLHDQPRKKNLLFDADASFKVIHLEGEKVRFETSNFPGMFMTARDDGSIVIERDPPLDPSTFILKPVAE